MTPEFKKLYEANHLDFLNEEEVNQIIKANNLDTNKISDGYHTFAQLYEHRIVLYIALCKLLNDVFPYDECPVWRSKKHSDGTEWEGWFLLGINEKDGIQITYHLPISKWDECSGFAILPQAPKFDGHTSEDVLKRLSSI